MTTINVGFSAFKPQTNSGWFTPASLSAQANINFGDIILQVFDLVTGNDVTHSFDSFCQNGMIGQLNSIPNTSHCHLALLQRYSETLTNYEITVAPSLGNTSSTNGALSSYGINPGDILIEAAYSTVANTSISPEYVTDAWAATVETANTLTQITGSANTYPTLFLLQKNGFSQAEIFLDLQQGPISGYLALSNGLAGGKIQQVLDITSGTDVSSNFWQYIGGELGGGGIVKYTAGTSNNDLFLIISTGP